MLHLKTRRFDLVEVLLVAALVGVTTFKLHPTIASQPSVELVDLERQYGPSKDSEHAEEWAIRDFFGNRRDGVFLDIGANHYRRFSNTYYLETVLGWSGIAVEPLKSFEADYVKFRPRTKFRPFFVSNVSNEQARMYLLAQNTLVTSSDPSFTARYGAGAKEVNAPTITVNDLLDAEHVARVDFVSIDVELHEPQVLAGFDLERFKPSLVCIEAHPEVRQQILDFFAARGYVADGRYLRADQNNLYFHPLPRGRTTVVSHRAEEVAFR